MARQVGNDYDVDREEVRAIESGTSKSLGRGSIQDHATVRAPWVTGLKVIDCTEANDLGPRGAVAAAGPLRAILIDDDTLALRELAALLAPMRDVVTVGAATDATRGLELINRLAPDLAFFEVEMQGRNGIEAVSQIDRSTGPEIIFVTSFDRYAVAAFDVEATDYLLKPVEGARLRTAVARAVRRRAERRLMQQSAVPVAGVPEIATPEATMHIPDRYGGRDIPIRDIVWIEAAKDYALVHTRYRTQIIRRTMTELVRDLDATFVRVHRSALVSLMHVWAIRRSAKGATSIVLVDEKRVRVGPTYADEVCGKLRAMGML